MFGTALQLLNCNYLYINGLVQDCSNSIANALELLQSCSKPSIYQSLKSQSTSDTPHPHGWVIGCLFWAYSGENLWCSNGNAWWCHRMETFSSLLAICAGNSPVPGEFPAQRTVMRSFDVFFDLRLNKLFSKPSWGWWFEPLSCPLWRHCNGIVFL